MKFSFEKIITQLDLALDQLAAHDLNADRFALMLVDNVVELVLHGNVKDAFLQNGNVCRDFDSKVKFAKNSGLIVSESKKNSELAKIISDLHKLRNTAYHEGISHEGIIHSLTIFYFKIACVLLKSHNPFFLSYPADAVSYRAAKYLGNTDFSDYRERLSFAWDRLSESVDTLPSNLIGDLAQDLKKEIALIDDIILRQTTRRNQSLTRDTVVAEMQAEWLLFNSKKAEQFASEKNFQATDDDMSIKWLGANYPFSIVTDPIPGWNRRLQSLSAEKSEHHAIIKYFEFMNQTKSFREQIIYVDEQRELEDEIAPPLEDVD